jgi:hypothetical protein
MENEQKISPTFDGVELNPAGVQAVESVKIAFTQLELALEGLLPNGRLTSLSKTALEESCLWAIKAISREEVYQTKGQVN